MSTGPVRCEPHRKSGPLRCLNLLVHEHCKAYGLFENYRPLEIKQNNVQMVRS